MKTHPFSFLILGSICNRHPQDLLRLLALALSACWDYLVEWRKHTILVFNENCPAIPRAASLLFLVLLLQSSEWKSNLRQFSPVRRDHGKGRSKWTSTTWSQTPPFPYWSLSRNMLRRRRLQSRGWDYVDFHLLYATLNTMQAINSDNQFCIKNSFSDRHQVRLSFDA